MSQTIAEILWFTGLIGWYVIRHPFERRARKTRVKQSLFDTRERILLFSATAGLFPIPAAYVLTGFPAALNRPFVPALAWVAIAPLVGALWLFRRSHADLGKNWSVTLKVRDEHAVVRHGVYRHIRHPMYASFFLLGLAQLLLLPNWLAGLAGLVGVGILYGFRVAREEQMMIGAFGDDYRAYMADTKRIIPFIL